MVQPRELLFLWREMWLGSGTVAIPWKSRVLRYSKENHERMDRGGNLRFLF